MLLMGPTVFGYLQAIRGQLIERGARVHFVDERPSNSFLAKFAIRLRTPLLGVIFAKYYRKILEGSYQYDIALIINPEASPFWFLDQLRDRLSADGRMICYFWDSIANKPKNVRYSRYFDKVLTFDFLDARNMKSWLYLPLFYSNENQIQSNGADETSPGEFDIVSVSTLHSDRAKVCYKVKRQADSLSLRSYFFFYTPGRAMYWIRLLRNFWYIRKGNFVVSRSPMPRKDVERLLSRSKVVLDVHHPSQTGLTMRTIETLGAGRKLLTTNVHVKDHDWFDPLRVGLIQREFPELSLEFVRSPVQKLNQETKEALCLESWIKGVLS